MSARPWPTKGADGEPVDPPWELHRAGRAWNDEAWKRYMLKPRKLEMVDGKLLHSDEDRELLLGLLLENIGADRRFGSAISKSGAKQLPRPRGRRRCSEGSPS